MLLSPSQKLHPGYLRRTAIERYRVYAGMRVPDALDQTIGEIRAVPGKHMSRTRDDFRLLDDQLLNAKYPLEDNAAWIPAFAGMTSLGCQRLQVTLNRF